MKLPNFAVDLSARKSLTEQVASGLRKLIAAGYYRVGDRLPSRRPLARHLGVSEFVVRAAFAELAADRLIGGHSGGGFRVLNEACAMRDSRLVLDVSTENVGSYSSCVNRVEFARTIEAAGFQVMTVVLGASRTMPYLLPLKKALSLRPDLVVIRTCTTRKRIAVRLVADSGCPYVTAELGCPTSSPGRFVGNCRIDMTSALDRFASDCVRASVRSVLQVDFGTDSYLSAESVLRARGIDVERLSVQMAKVIDLDELVNMTERLFTRRLVSRPLPDLVLVTDDYLSLGVQEALRLGGLRAPQDLRLVVYSNSGSGLFPTDRIARFEFDPREDGRQFARIVVKWLQTETLSPDLSHVHYRRGASFPVW